MWVSRVEFSAILWNLKQAVQSNIRATKRSNTPLWVFSQPPKLSQLTPQQQAKDDGDHNSNDDHDDGNDNHDDNDDQNIDDTDNADDTNDDNNDQHVDNADDPHDDDDDDDDDQITIYPKPTVRFQDEDDQKDDDDNDDDDHDDDKDPVLRFTHPSPQWRPASKTTQSI